MALTRRLWPAAESAQIDYETLREAALCGTSSLGAVAARFERGGLAGLIARPLTPPVFSALVVGAARPAWTPYADPRDDAMIQAYELLLTVVGHGVAREGIS